MGRTPSPQPQNIQQQNYQQPQIVVPFPPYKPMNSGGSTTNNLNSSAPAPVVNSINQSLATGTNSNYSSKFLRKEIFLYKYIMYRFFYGMSSSSIIFTL